MTKLAGDHVQVLVGGYELTGDSNRISLPEERNMYDVTAFRDQVHKFLAGQRTISLEHAGYMNADVARSHPVLKSAGLSGIVSIVLGQNDDPAAGDPMYSLLVRQGKYSVVPAVGNFVPFSALFATHGNRGGWGVALTPPVEISTSGYGVTVDNGAGSSNGGAVFLHVLEATVSDTYEFVVEGSEIGAFGGEETPLATFTLDGSAVGSERVEFGGSVPRYARWKATRSGAAGNAVEFAINLIRF